VEQTANGQRPTLLGVGQALVAHAVLRSVAAGRNGHLGLHADGALAERYYHRRGMRSCGPDGADEGSRLYFEGDAIWASEFLEATR